MPKNSRLNLKIQTDGTAFEALRLDFEFHLYGHFHHLETGEKLVSYRSHFPKKYGPCFQMLMANLTHAVLSNECIKISRRDDAYTDSKSNPLGLGKEIMITVVDWLVGEGYLTEIPFRYFPEQGISECSSYKPTPKFIYELERETRPPIVITKDRKGNLLPRPTVNAAFASQISIVLISKGSTQLLKLRDEDKASLPVPRTESVKSIKELVGKCNARLKKAKFTICRVQQVSPCLTRYFTETLDSNGRYFAFQFPYQNYPEAKRRLIQIDGESTCELDYGCTFITIAYNWRGLETPKQDAYLLDAFGSSKTDERYRKLAKRMVNILFNTGSRDEAVGAILRLLRGEEDLQGLSASISKSTIEGAIKEILEKHRPVSDLFFDKRTGLKLMFIESEICTRILNDFLDSDKVLLPVHDSFIAKAADREFLRTSMRTHWNAVLKEKSRVATATYDPVIKDKY